MASASGEIREGFLCPMCMKDLGTVSQLQSHFEEAHSNEDKATLNQLRGLFDRAKTKAKKILGDKEGEYVTESGKTSSELTTKSSNLYDVDYWQPQDLGVTRSWRDTLRSLRDARVDKYVVETNKLLIRLDKLINADVSMDSSKRKAFEKSVVMWMADSEVKSCRFCERSFSLTRRRHHCRLCGGIMCDRCSHFLTHDYARSAVARQKLTNPSFNFEGGKDTGFLKRSSSNSSLNSLFSTEGDPHIRSCQDCRKLLERRDQQVEQRNNKSDIVLMYDQMKSCIGDCERLLDTYLPMLESLSLGESSHSLFDAQRLRGELVRKYDIIDKISKRILNMGLDSETEPSQKQLLLQKSIRVYASNFMQENMMGLQSLPSEEQYAKLQNQRSSEIQKQIAQERLMMRQNQQEEKRKVHKQNSFSKDDDKQRESGNTHKRSGSSGVGWKPAEHQVRQSDSDPMLQQIEIIRGYIKQAREAQKWDEVNMLEQNLKDLQLAYSSQQKQTWS